jgi:hypothetical protein
MSNSFEISYGITTRSDWRLLRKKPNQLQNGFKKEKGGIGLFVARHTPDTIK